jgi:hypothetical protein
MRIGHEYDPPAGSAQSRQEMTSHRQPRDLVACRPLQCGNIEGKCAAPVFDAVPVERPVGRLGDRLHEPACLVDRQVPAFCNTPRQEFLPETVVEAQVEQRAVHVEQHRVDGQPVGRIRDAMHPPMI